MVLNIKQNKELRDNNFNRIIGKIINSYIKNPIGYLNLRGLPITRLPNGLKYIGGCLDISKTNIKELPKGLVVNGWLGIEDTYISELPDDIIIEGNLWCINTPLSKKYSKKELKDKYNIKGKIYGAKDYTR